MNLINNLNLDLTGTILYVLSAIILPGLSSLIKRPHWPIGVAGFITLVLSAVTGFVTEWAHSTNIHHYDWRHAVGLALSALVIAILSRFGLWKDTPTDNKLQSI